MKESNTSLVHKRIGPPRFHCEICGKEDEIPSRITIKANYGSVHDGERLTLDICGECADFIFWYLDMTSDIEKGGE